MACSLQLVQTFHRATMKLAMKAMKAIKAMNAMKAKPMKKGMKAKAKKATEDCKEGKGSSHRDPSDEGNEEVSLEKFGERVLQKRVHDAAAQLVSAVAGLGTVALLRPLPNDDFEWGLSVCAAPAPGGALITVSVTSSHIKAEVMRGLKGKGKGEDG